MQGDLHGGGIDARGIIAPISPYVFIGRGRDFAWSLTSAEHRRTSSSSSSNCAIPSGAAPTRASTHYVYKGRCRAMQLFDAGRLGAGDGQPARELTFYETVHGPVSGTVTVHGRPVRGRPVTARPAATSRRASWRSAISTQTGCTRRRSSSGPSTSSGRRSTGPTSTASRSPTSRRAGCRSWRPGTDPSLPALGTGRYDWRGWLVVERPSAHDRPAFRRRCTNWNNKPAPGWGAASDNYGYGSVHRVQLYRGFTTGMHENNDVSIMNRAATEDLRAIDVWPIIRRVLDGGPAPSRARGPGRQPDRRLAQPTAPAAST